MRDLNPYEMVLILIILVLGFAAVGSGDYADAVERERDQLRAAVAGCRLAQTMRPHEGQEVRP